MQCIENFIRLFGIDNLINPKNIITIENRIYLANNNLISLEKQIHEKIKKKPESIGTFLGTLNSNSKDSNKDNNTNFKPSIALIDLIGTKTNKKIIVGAKAEWLFLCGRDVFGKSIIKSNTNRGLAIITNQSQEVLGYGKLLTNLTNNQLLKKHMNKVVIKNLLDKGDFLRREMTKKY